MKLTSLLMGWLLCALAISAPSYAQSSIEGSAQAAYQNARDGAIKRGDLITSGADYERIKSISQKLIASSSEMRPDAGRWNWDVSYIRSNLQNAYCLPGGKIVVLSGLVEQLSLTDDELAAALGHEIGHVMLEHGNESYTQRRVAKVALGILGIVAAIVGAKHNVDPSAAFNATTGLGSLGAEFFALRPYGRERELDADRFGVELAARAGFDPSGAVLLQQKMGSGSTVEFLSTHPSSDTRVQELRALIPATAEKFASRRAPSQIVAAKHESPDQVTQSALSPAPALAQSMAITAEPLSLVAGPPIGAIQADPDAVVGPKAATMTSKFMISGEQYAKANGCGISAATMTVRAPTYETFAIKCMDNRELVIRCENNVCALAS